MKSQVDQFLAALAISKAEKTVISYRCGLKLYVKMYPDFTIDNVMAYAAWLHQNRERATLHLYLTAVARFAKWLKKTDRFSADEYMKLIERLEDVRGGRVPQVFPKVPKESDVQALVGAAQNAFDPGDTDRKRLMELRNIAIIHTLRATGCRVSEVTGLRKSDLCYSDKSATVIGKGRKERSVFFDDTAWAAVVTYLSARDKMGVGGLADAPIFCRYDRKSWGKVLPISTDVIRGVINKLEKGHTEEHQWPHRLRHRYGTEVLQDTHDLALVQDLMGHASPTTTRVYAKLDRTHLKEGYQKASL